MNKYQNNRPDPRKFQRFFVLALVSALLIAGTAAFSASADNSRFMSLQSLGEKCIDFSEVKIGTQEWEAAECAVSESGSFGTVEGQTYYYALYCLIPNYSKDKGKCGSDTFAARYHSSRGLAVFVQEGASNTAGLVFERASSEIGAYVYEKPQIIRNGAGTILMLTIRIDGTGSGNASEYYVRKNGQWQRVESESWIVDVRKKIPAGLEIWKGIWPDMQTMTAKAGLYRKGDANCCPTGGEAKITLAIEDNRFVVRSVTVELGPKKP
jgi:hypothetical protein